MADREDGYCSDYCAKHGSKPGHVAHDCGCGHAVLRRRRPPARERRVAARAPARERWNERYAGDGFSRFERTRRVARRARELLGALAGERAAPRALDVACGDGRNARLLAELGFAVDAIDVSDVAVAALREPPRARAARRAAVVDLERDGLPDGSGTSSCA